MRDEIKSLKKGWRRSMRNGSWYRKGDGWIAVVHGSDEGFALVLNKRMRTFEDCLAEANEIIGEYFADRTETPVSSSRLPRTG